MRSQGFFISANKLDEIAYHQAIPIIVHSAIGK